jgi:hypothetical protein
MWLFCSLQERPFVVLVLPNPKILRIVSLLHGKEPCAPSFSLGTPMMLIAQALLAYTFTNVNATDEWSEWFWRSFRARQSH